jgi:hypothetical protein
MVDPDQRIARHQGEPLRPRIGPAGQRVGDLPDRVRVSLVVGLERRVECSDGPGLRAHQIEPFVEGDVVDGVQRAGRVGEGPRGDGDVLRRVGARACERRVAPEDTLARDPDRFGARWPELDQVRGLLLLGDQHVPLPEQEDALAARVVVVVPRRPEVRLVAADLETNGLEVLGEVGGEHEHARLALLQHEDEAVAVAADSLEVRAVRALHVLGWQDALEVVALRPARVLVVVELGRHDGEVLVADGDQLRSARRAAA